MSHWTRIAGSFAREGKQREDERMTVAEQPPALPWAGEAVTAYGCRHGTRKALPAERLLGLG